MGSRTASETAAVAHTHNDAKNRVLVNPPPVEVIDPQTGHPRKWQILAIMCTCLILVVAGVSSLNIAIPSIIDDLDPTSTQTLWIVDGYALVFAGLLLPAGALGDRYGRKGALLGGLMIFAAAALWSAWAGSPNELIIARGAMGVGAAFAMPATLSILVSVFPVHERAKAIAVWSGFAGAGGAIGIIVGGSLLEKFWWGSVFFINVPIAALAAGLIIFLVPTSRDEHATPLDPVGSLLSIAGLGALVYAIIEGGEIGWLKGTTIGFFAAAVVLLAGWYRWEGSTKHPMLPTSLFKRVPFSMGSLTITAGFAVMFGMFFLITQYFQFVQGHGPLAAGVRNLPFAVTMVVVSPRSPAIAAKYGKRVAMTAGLSIQVLGFIVLSQLDVDTPYIWAAIGIMLLAAGMALLMPAASEAIVSSVPPSKAGVGSAVNDTTREVGGALGIAVMGSLLASGYRSGIEDDLVGLPNEAVEVATEGIGPTFRLAQEANLPQLVQPAQDAFVSGMSTAFIAAGIVSAVTAAFIYWRYPSLADEPGPVAETARLNG